MEPQQVPFTADSHHPTVLWERPWAHEEGWECTHDDPPVWFEWCHQEENSNGEPSPNGKGGQFLHSSDSAREDHG